MEASEAKLISSRPERIEEIDWRTDWTAYGATSDSVREIRFSFYNDHLYEMTVSYDRDRTGGMTDTDMTEALSGIYGPASAPATREMSFNAGYNSTVRVIAQWDDQQSLLSLVGLSYPDGFGLVISSKQMLTLAQRATTESERLDRVEAPQRALQERAKEAAEAKAKDEQYRLVNKPGFRP